MNEFLIKPNKQCLTSQVFYLDVLQQVDCYFNQDIDKDIVFDFSDLETINPLVIPNLCCLGLYIKARGIKPKLLVISKINSFNRNVAAFLDYAGFYTINQKWGIFDLVVPSGGYDPGSYKDILIFGFLRDSTKQQIASYLNDRSYNVLYKIIESFPDFDILENNLKITPDEKQAKIEKLILNISEPISQLCFNSIEHGHSFTFATLNYVKYSKKILIAVSDCGEGFLFSLINKQNKIINDKFLSDKIKSVLISLLNMAISDKKNSNLYAIIAGLVYRFFPDKNDSIYGLYSIVRHFLECNGYVRVHSFDTQIILSKKHLNYLNPSSILQLPKILLNSKEYNIRYNTHLVGVHIELEMKVFNEIEEPGEIAEQENNFYDFI